jgi:SHS2 domain-containing protein
MKGGKAKAPAKEPVKGQGWDGEDGGGDAEEPDSEKRLAGPSGSNESERRILELLDKEQTLCAPKAKGKGNARARPEKFRFLDHTADIGIQAFGETLGEAFENAALGMFNIITDPSKVGAQKDFEITIEGDDLKNLLHEWLDQLLILSQVNNMLFSSFKVNLKDLDNGVGLTGLVMGEPADPSKHVYKTEIKAVTHHMLEVRTNPPMVKVLFDI